MVKNLPAMQENQVLFLAREDPLEEGIATHCSILWASLVAQRLKRLPGMRETRVQSLGWEDPLEKEMATHSSILAWRIPWMEEPGGLHSTGLQRVRHDCATSLTLQRPTRSPKRPSLRSLHFNSESRIQ